MTAFLYQRSLIAGVGLRVAARATEWRLTRSTSRSRVAARGPRAGCRRAEVAPASYLPRRVAVPPRTSDIASDDLRFAPEANRVPGGAAWSALRTGDFQARNGFTPPGPRSEDHRVGAPAGRDYRVTPPRVTR